MAKDTRNKIASIHLNDETFAALQRLSELTGATINSTAKHYLEELEPILTKTVEGLEAIRAGENADEVLKEMLAYSFSLVGEKIKKS